MLNITLRNRATAVLNDFIITNNISGKFLLPANICPIVPLVFIKNNIKVKFIDISKKNFDMDKSLIFENLEKFDGLLWNNSYGKEDNNSNFFLKCKKNKKNFFIIDDRCLNEPNLSLKRQINSDLEIYSTGYSKYCDLGHGGYGLSPKKISYFPNSYNKFSYEYIIKKFYSSIKNKNIFYSKKENWLENKNNINSLEYFKKIKKLKRKIKIHKKKINSIYEQLIPNKLKVNNIYNNWRYNILTPNRDILLNEIFQKGLFASNHYYPSSKIFQNKHMKNSDYVAKNILNLFNDLRFNEKMAIKISQIIKNHYLKYGYLRK